MQIYFIAAQVFRPDWIGKPVVFLSNNDGCILSENKPAIGLFAPAQPIYLLEKESFKSKVLEQLSSLHVRVREIDQ